MDPKVNYTAVGLFVVLLTVAFLVIVLWLSSEWHKSFNTYLIYFKEPVSGLTTNAPVKFNGVDIGYVEKISLDPEDPQEVRVVVRIEREMPITQSTVATLMSQGITGITFVGLKAKSPRAPLLRKNPSAPYPVIPSEPSLLVQLNTALREVRDGMRSVSTTLKTVFDQGNLQSIKTTLTNLSKASEHFPVAISKIEAAANGVTQTTATITSAGEQFKVTMQNGNAAIQSLSQQILPEVYEATSSIKDTFNNLKAVTAQMKQNPSVIIRGTTPLPKGPGE